MLSKSNNEVKEFAVGTKIEYNCKLYEVTESNSCADCSIASVCSSSNKSINITGNLLREERIKIFGECSSGNRADGKSVVFVEVPKDKSKDDSKDDYYKISPLWSYNNPTQLRPIKFLLPKDYVIDKEHSDLDKGIIRFKNKWLTLEQLYKNYKNRVYHFAYSDSIKDFSNNKLVAIANLMDIASYFNKGWSYDVNQDVVGYLISYDRFVKEPCYNIRKNDSTTDVYYGNPVFKNEADAQYVIDNPNFREVLDNIFKV